MKLTRERRILLTILGLGLAALVFDRLVLEPGNAGPAAAVASQTKTNVSQSAEPESTSKAADAGLWPTDAGSDAASLSRRITQAAAEAGIKPDAVRDAFAMPAGWSVLRTDSSAKEGDAKATAVAALPPEKFQKQHRLMAVMGSGNHAIAMIDGQALRVGQQLDGYTLIEAQQRSAVFVAGAQHVTLSMNGQ